MAKMNYKEYGVNKLEWQKLREKIVFQRAQLRCEMCGVLSQMTYIWSDFKQVTLPIMKMDFKETQNMPKHVHNAQMHLSHIDDDKLNMKENNLLCLCACCHDLFDRRKEEIRLLLLDNVLTLGIIKANNISLSIKHLGDSEFEYIVTKNE